MPAVAIRQLPVFSVDEDAPAARRESAAASGSRILERRELDPAMPRFAQRRGERRHDADFAIADQRRSAGEYQAA